MTTNRKTVRQNLQILFKAKIPLLADEAGGVEHCLDHLPYDLKGISPVTTIESDSVQPNFNSDITGTEEIRLIISNWVKREDDPDGAEDTLDDLAHAQAEVLRKNELGRYNRPSQLDYELISGEEYRVEFHYLTIIM